MRALRYILAVLMLLIAPCLRAQDTSAQESRRAQLEKEIAQIQEQLNDNKKRSNSALNELTLIRKQIATRKALVAQSDKELRIIDDSIRVARREIKEIQNRIDTLSLYFDRLIRSVYRNRDTRMWYLHLLSSSSLSQASRRYMYLKNISSQLNSQASKLKELKVVQEQKLTRLSELRASAAKLRASRQKDLDKLNAEEKRSKSVVNTLNRNKTRYQKDLANKRKQVTQLNKEIESIIASYMKGGTGSNSGSKAAPIDYKLAAEFEANKGKLPWPADGPVLEPFGKHRHPVYTRIEMPFNNGIGIGLSAGTAVNSVFDGEVKRVIVMPGYNKCVLVQHGSYFSFYCKLSQVNVKAGDKVVTGQKIGVVDTIDGQTLLHFQVWKEKTPQNPELWLRKR